MLHFLNAQATHKRFIYSSRQLIALRTQVSCWRSLWLFSKQCKNFRALQQVELNVYIHMRSLTISMKLHFVLISLIYIFIQCSMCYSWNLMFRTIFPDRVVPPPPPIELDEGSEYEVKTIWTSRLWGRNYITWLIRRIIHLVIEVGSLLKILLTPHEL